MTQNNHTKNYITKEVNICCIYNYILNYTSIKPTNGSVLITTAFLLKISPCLA